MKYTLHFAQLELGEFVESQNYWNFVTPLACTTGVAIMTQFSYLTLRECVETTAFTLIPLDAHKHIVIQVKNNGKNIRSVDMNHLRELQ